MLNQYHLHKTLTMQQVCVVTLVVQCVGLCMVGVRV